MPVGNGVTDGSLPFILTYLFMGCFGNQFWRYPVANAGTEFEITFIDTFATGLIALQIYIMSRK